MTAKNSPEYVKWLLANNNVAVERAILALYGRQDADERASASTVKSNGRGFNAFDAKNGTYYAKWLLSGRNLSGRHLEKARAMAYKYVRQLCEVATETLVERARQAELELAIEREAIQSEGSVDAGM